MELHAAQIAELVGGTLHGPDVVVRGARHDSREIVGGELFVPVVAERDGHDFIDAAVARGAAAYLTAKEPRSATAIVVDDPVAALTALGAHARTCLGERVVGITGSMGKTSTKDLAAAVLRTRFTTVASARSFNNELGVPLTLLDAPEGTEAAVIEMGMRGHGHIAALCDIARPTIGVVTAVSLVHVELVDGLDGVARAKGELVEGLPHDGVAVLNRDDERVRAMASRTEAAVVFVGDGGHVAAEKIELDAELRPSFVLVSDWGSTEVRVASRGVHQVGNALAAAAVGLWLGVDVADVAAGLAAAELSPWRMELRRSATGAAVLNDAYNAGPASTAAALRSLVSLDADRYVAVLGTMAELGEHAPRAHREIAELAHELGVELISVAEPAYEAPVLVDDRDAALDVLGLLDDRTAVLVKASRVVGLEHLVDALLSR